MTSRSHGKTNFQMSWLQDNFFKSWLKPEKLPSQAICTLCNNALISVDKMGVSALSSHAQGKKHKEKEKQQSPLSCLFFQPSSSKLKQKESNSSTSSSSTTIDSLIISLSVSKAEIRWVLKVVSSSFSLHKCLNLNALFKEMFSDSKIADSFKLSKTKCGYYPTYGIVPYLKSNITKSILKAPYFTIMFDEILNSVLQNEQMDMQIRYWSDEDCKVQTKYYDSKFLKIANSDTICCALLQALNIFDEGKMLMLSIDSPTTNWVVLDKLKQHREENEMPVLFDIGSCSLHVVHGAFQVGVEATKWNLSKAMWKILHDWCARRDVYKTVNRTDLFPLSFCKTCWIEDKNFAARGIAVWPYMIEFIKYYQSLSQSKRPKNNKSYDLLVQSHTDHLTFAKIQFFHDIANILSEFLTKFQTDKPVMPFLSDILESILRRLMKFFILAEVIKTAATAYKLIKLDVFDKNILLPVSSVKFATATATATAFLSSEGISA